MKSIKSFGSVNRMLGTVRRRASAPVDTSPETTLATPEANASRSVKLFCESGGPDHTQGDEVLHLPTIVEAAVSSPAAAKECAYLIRKFLSKDNKSRTNVQYNAVMLMRILSDNPGPSFTRYIDKKYVETVKELIRMGRDPSVQLILRDTLDTFERDKKSDVNLDALMEMWSKEKTKMVKAYGQGAHTGQSTPAGAHDQQNYFSRSHNSNRLPSPDELASRVEEARTSAKLLTQLVQSTPPTELLQNELIREFANRCQSASRSMQAYMVAENPAPDNDTMLTLIETNEQLSLATTKHQRTVLQTRRALGVGTPDQTPSPSVSPPAASGYAPPLGPPPANSKPPPPPSRNPVRGASQTVDEAHSAQTDVSSTENPFTDPVVTSRSQVVSEPVMDQNEPYHPGFSLTKSYTGRQESAIGKTAMHAAGPSALQEESDQRRVSSEEEDDPYSAPALPKAAVYRY